MGLNPSKRVDAALRGAPAFAAACDDAFGRCLADAQYAFAGVRPLPARRRVRAPPLVAPGLPPARPPLGALAAAARPRRLRAARRGARGRGGALEGPVQGVRRPSCSGRPCSPARPRRLSSAPRQAPPGSSVLASRPAPGPGW
ncbi:hypothetical protein OsJ_15314 [Oryza sativa Japonica Group]|uniref:Uncharacterized protein n=1 Tax=Oryza sativa subsp. japonica TaxID=39947 RepID=B9FFW9_ORYSJ|nr:hypothetical protein OsJ_15314 [Oryza sativa Japonica Group]